MNNNSPFNFKVVDFSVTHQTFELNYNPILQLYKTEPQPSEAALPEYYKSDEYISHTDANKNFLDKIYQKVKRITSKSKLKLIEKHVGSNEKTLLDIGCGTGDFLLTASTANWSVVGVEPNPPALSLAKDKLKANTELFTSLDALLNGIENKKFNIITLWHVLEHVPNYDEYITKIKLLLKPEGTLIIAVPNFNSFDAKYYKSYWAAYDVPRHLWHFSKSSINSIFLNHNMYVKNIKPMWFDSFYVALLSEKYKTGKNSFFKPFWVGMLSNLKAVINKESSSLIYVIQNKKN